MDPITAVGALGAVVGIIDVVTKTISGLREVGAQYKDAELGVIGLVSQLTALRAALSKIRQWMDSEPTETHYQLAMDLGNTLSCCGMLMEKLESEVIRLQRSADGKLSARSKLKFALNGKSIEDLQGMVGHQMDSLNVLLNSYNIKSVSEQRALLESSTSRQIFKIMEKDVSSLYVHRDSASILTEFTDRLSLLSREFAFDRILWVSKVYKDASPRLMEAMRERARQKANQEADLKRSQSIDRILKHHANITQQMVLLSATPKLGPEFMKAFRSWGPSGSCGTGHKDGDNLRPIIQQAAVSLIEQCATLAQGVEDEFPPAVAKAVAVLSEASRHSDLQSPKAAESLQRLWEDRRFQQERVRAEKEGSGMPSCAEYVVENFDRLIADDYSPTTKDVLHAWARPTAIDETVLHWESLMPSLTVSSIGHFLLKSGKWMKYVGSKDPIVFFLVDIAGYDRHLVEDRTTNEMMEAMTLFDSVINSPSFSSATPVVVFSNIDLFKEKAERSPVRHSFPEYTGGPKFDEAVKYFGSRFRHLYRGGKEFHAINVEPEDRFSLKRCVELLCDLIIQENLGI